MWEIWRNYEEKWRKYEENFPLYMSRGTWKISSRGEGGALRGRGRGHNSWDGSQYRKGRRVSRQNWLKWAEVIQPDSDVKLKSKSSRFSVEILGFRRRNPVSLVCRVCTEYEEPLSTYHSLHQCPKYRRHRLPSLTSGSIIENLHNVLYFINEYRLFNIL